MSDTTDRRDTAAPDIYALFGIPRHHALPAPAPRNMTQALLRLPAVIDDADLLWRGAAIVKAASARGGLRVADAMRFGGG